MFLTFYTKRYEVLRTSSSNEKEQVYVIVEKGLFSGVYRVAIYEKSICVLGFDFGRFKEIKYSKIKEIFPKYMEKVQLPLYFNMNEMDDVACRALKDLGAQEVTESETVWGENARVLVLK